ncbi:hypothetical protein P875_00095411 [Aspergillus parasiticus SU-1]|uniref:C6 transcription factor n=1 Tax=Aspergillus parasiticus (strain ATCC 56775 / NRRL 5862 / SRRC 143 / SU-1) TaxID=1403190 RepID=A0A0F0I6Z8_ASPPU|nr:hypothetical protein P875_00095411 [Aspergillus parasiticus SU-1]
MVSTRHHPRDFPPPSTGKASSPSNNSDGATNRWVHAPSTAIIIWLVVSFPVVIWDAGYVLLRPHSMPGNKLHFPMWIPYARYGAIDYIYSWPAFNARNGFPAAQTVLNLVECIGYIYYLWMVYRHGVSASGGRGQRKAKKGLMWMLRTEKVVSGRTGATALLVAYSASLATLSKTVVYLLNEVFSGFDNIGHNDAITLIFLWIIPKGASGLWIIFPGYNSYVLGAEIVASLESAVPRQRVG